MIRPRWKWVFPFLCLVCFLFTMDHRLHTVSCPTSVEAILDLTADQISSPDITVEIAEDQTFVIIRDYYWNPQNSYSTARAFAERTRGKLKVSVIHDTAPSELQSMGSNAVMVKVSLPEGFTSCDLEKIIVRSRDPREGQIKKEFPVDAQ